jgi:hypothetical protein
MTNLELKNMSHLELIKLKERIEVLLATDKRQCPDHTDGQHVFIPCDDLPATCVCGKQEHES